jgi:hypothetical protein
MRQCLDALVRCIMTADSRVFPDIVRANALCVWARVVAMVRTLVHARTHAAQMGSDQSGGAGDDSISGAGRCRGVALAAALPVVGAGWYADTVWSARCHSETLPFAAQGGV